MLAELFKPNADNENMWDDFVYRSPGASHCHLSGWRRVIERAYGHRTYYIWAHENGETKGILPLVLIRSNLFGKTLVSMPFLDEGGICSGEEKAKVGMYQKSLELYEDLKADSIDMRHRRPSGIVLPCHGSKVTFTLKLDANPDQMWKHFDAKLRNQIRKSLKSGMTATWTGKEGLSDFYRVFATNMRDLGSPVHSRIFFASILDEFPDSARFILVHKGSETIGGGLCLLFKDTVFMPWASSKKEYLSMCPNNLLYWEVIRSGCLRGYRVFDFGRSSRGSGPYKFKKQWGAIEEPLHWQLFSRHKNWTPTVSTPDSRYRWGVYAWKRLPLTIANSLGPILRKQISN